MVIQPQTSPLDPQTVTNRLSKSLSQFAVGTADSSSGASPTWSSLGVSSDYALQAAQLSGTQGGVTDSLSIAQTQSAYLNKIGSALDKMSQLAAAAQSPGTTDAQRAELNQQFHKLAGHIHSAASKEFNGVSLFSGASQTVTTNISGGTLTLPGIDLNDAAYAGVAGADLTTNPEAAAQAVKLAQTQLSRDQSTADSNAQQLQSASEKLMVAFENFSAVGASVQSSADADVSMQQILATLASPAGNVSAAQTAPSAQTIDALLQIS